MRRYLERAARHRSSLAVAFAYLAGSLALFGHGVLAHPEGDYVGWSVGADPQGFIWALGWWPHAVLHGLNPFVTHLVDAPGGINLAWATSVPGIALVLAPLTLTLGAVFAYNVAALLAPALAAWTAFLLVRYLSGSAAAAALAGAFFGFSPYMAGQLAAGHLHLTTVFLVPLAALVVLRFLRGELSARGFALRFGGIIAGQLLVATEIAFTLSLALLISLVLVAAVASTLRGRVRAAVAPIAGGYAFAALLTSPLLAYALSGYRARSLEPPARFPADLLNLVVPTSPALVGDDTTRSVANTFVSGVGESGAYLGVVALGIVAAFLWRERRSAVGRVLGLALALGVLCELGTRLSVHGRSRFVLPWELVSGWPGFRDVLPVRLSMFVSLLVAVAIGLWAARAERKGIGLALGAVALLTVLPSPRREIWTTSPPTLAFFADKISARCLHPGETVLMVPVPVQSYGWLWQTESGYGFRMIDGNLVQSPPEPALFVVDISHHLSPTTAPRLLALVRARGATTIVVTAHFAFWERLLDRYVSPQRVGGALLFRLGAAPPSCPARAAERDGPLGGRQ